MQSFQTGRNKLIPTLILAVALIAIGYAIRRTFSCFLLAFVLAYLLDPFVVLLERRKLARVYGIVILYAILGVAAIFCFAYVVPLVSMRWESLIRELPLYLQKAKVIFAKLPERFEPVYATEEWNWLVSTLTGNMDKVFSRLASGVYTTVTQVVFNLFTLILAPILVFFMLFYKHEVIAGIAGWIPSARRNAFLSVGREINASIGGYIRGQLVVSLIVAVLSTVALFTLQIDYFLLNGIFAGFASILPFIGVIIATLPALFFAYVKFQSGVAMFKVIAAFGIIYFLEGYVIKPLVFKEAMNLNPLVTILVVMACGELMGFWGILLAIPIAAAVKIVLYHLRRGDFAAED